MVRDNGEKRMKVFTLIAISRVTNIIHYLITFTS